MKISRELDLRNFEAWSGAVDTLNKLIELDVVEQAEALIEEMFCESIPTETEINDLLWFDDEFIFESLGIEQE